MGCGSSRAVDAAPGVSGGGGRGPQLTGDPNNRRIHRVPPPNSWKMEGAGMTQAELERRRTQFWDSCVSGRAIVWQNLRLVCEALLNYDTELASSIVDASGCRAPRGDLTNALSLLVFDALGASYELPRFVWSTPANIISEAEAAALAAKARASSRNGANVAAVELAVRMRLAPSASSCEQDVTLTVKNTSTVDELKQRLHDALLSGAHDQKRDENTRKPNVWSAKGLPPARQRVMFRGRELRDGTQQLHECAGMEAGAILQVFIRPE